MVDGGVGHGSEGGGVVEEQRGVVATSNAAGETEFEALDPVGGVGDVGGAEGQVNGKCPELCAILVGLGARGLDHEEVAAGHEAGEQVGVGVGVDNAVD